MLEIVAFVLLTLQPIEPVAEGLASYYTRQSSSDLTASGELLCDLSFTCAMPNGQFGNYYLVVAENGRSVVCRLNDRGPFVEGRVIDLSKAAMRELHPRDGLIPVRVYALGSVPPPMRKPMRR